MKKNSDKINELLNYSLSNIIEDRYSKYAKYIIQERALPDARDGLKPVQRRILYAMYNLNLNYKSPHKKSARIVGEVIGKYHPHGDSSVYEAMVRMSQDWKTNMPLIDMQGNNGSIDGDSPAAMRYTEVKLSKISSWLLKDLNSEIVKFVSNFDDSEVEPHIFPSPFPNLLINGANGIAAGYATNIPPHNLNEVVDALIYRIKNPKCTIDEILKIITGPDFPTRGIIQGKEGLKEAYETGKGQIIIKSKILVEKNKLYITEIPYDVNKKLLIQKIDDIRLNQENDINIKRVQDYTDKNGISIMIEVGNEEEIEYIKHFLLKKTSLQITYNYNMVVIIDKKPVQCNILNILDCYINHRCSIILKKTQYELKKINHQLEILRGLMKCVSIVDEVIKIIRVSNNKNEAIENLKREFNFTHNQADAIVLLRLYRLTSTDIKDLKFKLESLSKEQSTLKKLFKNSDLINDYIINELKEIKNDFYCTRKSLIGGKIEVLTTNELLQKEKLVFFTVSKKGYIKLYYDNGKINKNNMTKKYNDMIISRVTTSNKNKLFIITDKGNYFSFVIDSIPVASNTMPFGVHVSQYVKFSLEENIISTFIFDPDNITNKYIAIFTKNGLTKKVNIEKIKTKNNKLMPLVILGENDYLVNSFILNDDIKFITSITRDGYIVKYNTDIIKEYKNLKTAGNKFINLNKNDWVLFTQQVDKDHQECLVISNSNQYKIFDLDDEKLIICKGIGRGKRISSNLILGYAFLINKDTNLLSFKSDKTISNNILEKIYLSKRKSTFQKIPTDNVIGWNIEKILS